MYRIITLLFMWLGVGCQTVNQADINTKTMYRPVREHLQKGELKQAEAQFPKKEQGQFITTMEKAWLGLLSGDVDTNELIALSQNLEDRKTVRFSYEARKFFLKELDEAYLPAEHEVILFHIITGLIFAKQGQADLARVEATRAARYLEGHFGDYGGEFDDPAIRILLAGLWIYCDDWQHARVDFKVAGKLSKDYRWATKLAKQDTPPKNLIMVLQGVGPEIVWRPNDSESKRWQLQFVFEEEQQKLSIHSENQPPVGVAKALDSKSWYVRHFERDSAPRSALDNVRHGADVAVGAVGAAGMVTLAVVGATIIVVAAVAASVLAVAISGQLKSPELVGAAMTMSADLIAATIPVAVGVGSAGIVEASGIYDNAADESEGYRYVRFLPSNYYFTTSDKPMVDPKLYSEDLKLAPQLSLKSKSGNQVLLYFMPK